MFKKFGKIGGRGNFFEMALGILKLWILTQTPNIPEHYVAKDKKEQTFEDKADVLKDAKVRNLLQNSLDNIISNKVIGCEIAKETWGAWKCSVKEPKQSERIEGQYLFRIMNT